MSIQNMKRSETTEQIALFNWAKRTESILPELALMYHVPNEGKRSNGGILKAAGLKSGVPDICLPVANNGFHGLYIELKFGKNKATKAQEEYMAMLNAQGYKTAVCYGAEEAGEEILAYLTEPGRMPKKACVNAPWINGKCDGINLPSRMFSREECRGCKNFNPGREERIINEILSEHPEKREIKSAKADKTGSCSFCGQTKIIQVPEEWEQGQINEAVTCECECEQAQAYAKAKERKDKAKKRVNELFGSGAEKPVAEDVVNLLIATVDAIEDKHMKGITVDVGHGVKAKVSKMAKESIKVERSENKKTTYEE